MNFASVAALAAAGALVATGASAQSREQIRITGSSTVFPYTQAVSEEYSAATGNPAPVVEGTGTGGGMRIFCGGVGVDHPDITGASRPMTQSEYELCQSNGVDDITEVLIGFDGLSLATSEAGPDIELTKAQIFQALAAEVEVDGEIVSNPFTNWNEIDDSFPDLTITVLGPPPTSGTRDAWVDLVMEEGCEAFPAIQALEGDRKDEVCQRMRTDGPFIEAGENDNLIVQRLVADTSALGIFGFSFLYENTDVLKGIVIDGVEPTSETIASGEYGVARPLYFYIKNAHRGVIPGLDEFVNAYVSEDAISPDGYLIERGLVPLSEEQRETTRQTVEQGGHMDRYGG